MHRRHRFTLLGASLLLLGLASSAHTASTPVTCNPMPSKMKALVTQNGFPDRTTSLGYDNIPPSGITFVQGGTKPSCVVLRFWAEASASHDNSLVEVRPLLDNSITALPDRIILAARNNRDSRVAGSFEFIFPSVAPGRHTIQMQWRSGGVVDTQFEGWEVALHYRSTIVLYAP